jgi:hypothetical protein
LIVRRWQLATGAKAFLIDKNQSFDERVAQRLTEEVSP